MKKLISIFIAFLIFLNSAGYIVVFWKLQQDTKREMFQKISTDVTNAELTCINISKREISYTEFKDKDEFEYKGSMYDVVKKRESDKYYTFYCLNDEKESLLIKNFGNHFDDNKEKTSQNNSRTLISQIAPAIIKNNETVKRIDIVSQMNNQISSNYKSIYINKFTPPPRT